jgi:molecular chaperone DnaK (HSP70)
MKDELVKYVIKQFKKETGINLSYAYEALNKLHIAADRI